MSRSKPIRYLVHNPFEDVPTSYAVSYWGDDAEEFARFNARLRGGQVEAQFEDRSVIVEDYSSKAWAR
jgi:hypothetical protein